MDRRTSRGAGVCSPPPPKKNGAVQFFWAMTKIWAEGFLEKDRSLYVKPYGRRLGSQIQNAGTRCLWTKAWLIPYDYAPMCVALANLFVQVKRFARNYRDPPVKFDPGVPPSKVTQRHRNQRGSISY